MGKMLVGCEPPPFREKTTLLFETLPSDAPGLNAFLNLDADGESVKAALSFPVVPERDDDKGGDFVFKDEHNEFYRAVGFTWPPDLDAVCSHRYKFASMSPRAKELMYFLDQHWPVDEREVLPSEMYADFVDVGQSISRLLKAKPDQHTGWHNPWARQMPTITAHAFLVVRTAKREGASEPITVQLRAIEGYELMAVSGWDPSFYSSAELPGSWALTSLAGNAFSAFAAGPVALLGIASSPFCTLGSAVARSDAACAVDRQQAAEEAEVVSLASSDESSRDSCTAGGSFQKPYPYVTVCDHPS